MRAAMMLYYALPLLPLTPHDYAPASALRMMRRHTLSRRVACYAATLDTPLL